MVSQRIKEVESKYKVELNGKGLIALEISKDGIIKSIKVKVNDKNHEELLMEIGKQIKVIKPAMKNDVPIGTKFAFKIEL